MLEYAIMRYRMKSVGTGVAMALVLLGALWLRTFDLNWDENHHVHPDERWITMVAMETAPPEPWSDVLNPRESALNPYWNLREDQPRRFAYGSFPLYLVRLVATGVSAAATSDIAPADPAWQSWRNANDYDHINLVGRALSAVFDTITVALVFLLGRRLYGTGAGLLGAFLTALTVQLIQLAHFYAFDTVATTVVVAAVYFGVRVVQGGGPRDSIFLGAMTAVAVASKFSALPLLLVVVLAHALGPLGGIFWNATAQTRLSAVATSPIGMSRHTALELSRALSRILLCLFAGVIIFALVSPFTFLDFAGYAASIGEQSDMVRGLADFPYTRQYRNTDISYWFENWTFWAVGPALGAAGLAGLAIGLVRMVRRTATPAELVVLAWVVPYLAITLSFQVKFLRYLAPVTPFLALMAAGTLWRIAVPTGGASGARLRVVWFLPAALVAAATALYAAAFLQIYDGSLTRVRASEWIYRNAPAGAAISDETWDDSLPFARTLDGRARSQGEYRLVTMNLHEPDDRAKLDNLRRWLESVDYVIISSNRMYGWLPRLKERFPITRRYYDLLFAEQLGFARAAVFTAYPRLGPVSINDDGADESFTVYDHPKVLIFRKVRSLPETEFRALFADVPPALQPSSNAQAMATRDRTLLLSAPVDQLPVVNDRGWNLIANSSNLFAVLWWWLVLQLLGLLALPAALRIFARFADGGYAFAKSLGLLAVAWLMWIGASLHLVMHHALTLWVITLVLLLVAGAVLWRGRATLLPFLRLRGRLILFEEALFTLAFVAFVGVRLLNPDLWQPWNGGEKFMEFAFLNAILKSPSFPPYDPYFAGGYINYYYYGIYLVGVLVKLTGIVSEVAFNLAVPTMFALTLLNAFAIAYNLAAAPGTTGLRARALLSGLCAASFVAVIGNLDGVMQIVDGFGKASGIEVKSGIAGLDGLMGVLQGFPAILFGGKTMPAFDYWRSSRVIPNTINEFPYWSFLFADLHPHMIGIPFTLLAIALAAHAFVTGPSPARASGTELDGPAELATPIQPDSLHVRGVGLYVRPDRGTDARRWFDRLLSGGALALTLGAIAAINTWDAPTYFGIALGAIVLRRVYSRAGSALLSVAGAAAIGVASLAMYAPFFANYKALYVGLGLTDIHTDPQPFLVMWGFLGFGGVSFALVQFFRRRNTAGPFRSAQVLSKHVVHLPRLLELGEAFAGPAGGLHAALVIGALLLVVTVALIAFSLPVIAVLVWCFGVTVLLLFRSRVPPEEQFLVWLAFWAFAILLGVEIVFLQDFLGGEWKRMNTLFKFYIQVWVLLGLLVGTAVPSLWIRASASRSRLAPVWRWVFIVLLGGTIIFPVAGTAARVSDRFPTGRPPIGTLDGMEYMRSGVYAYPDEKNRIEMQYDLDAIRWLQDNVQGTPVLAEAVAGYYREAGMRVSSYTGLPALLGMHQSEQRYADDVGRRDGEAREFFNTADTARAMELARQLRVRYIYVGPLERATYPPGGIEKFELLVRAGVLDVAYRNEQVTIYRTRL